MDKEGAEGRHQEALQGHHWRLCPLFVLEHRLVSSASVSLEVVNFCFHHQGVDGRGGGRTATGAGYQ